MRKTVIGIAGVLLLLLLSGCPYWMAHYAFSPPEWILGTWEEEDSHERYFTFTDNDIASHWLGTASYSQRYSFPNYQARENFPFDDVYTVIITNTWGSDPKSTTETFHRTADGNLTYTREWEDDSDVFTRTLVRVADE